MSYISDKDSAPISLFGVNGGNTTTDASLATLVGAKFNTPDGRVFVLVQNGGTALVSGVMVQSPATIGANHTGLAVVGLATANPIGSTSITVTLGGTLVTANQYAGGFAVVSAGTGIGQTLKIASHPAQSTTTGNVVLTLEDPLSVAITSTDSKVSLTLPQYGSQNGTDVTTSGVIIAPSTPTGRIIGATIYPIPASTSTVPTYGFIQTSGACAVLNQGGTTIGLGLSIGSVSGSLATAAATTARHAVATVAGEDGKSQLVTLQL